ncbi:Permeases of the major facilitator superfamily protein [Clostridiaceae bacterium JG1575]|nr:Permeases of the major facilitator superfamily protein [Clostridiaceae bacterium JG1575]
MVQSSRTLPKTPAPHLVFLNHWISERRFQIQGIALWYNRAMKKIDFAKNSRILYRYLTLMCFFLLAAAFLLNRPQEIFQGFAAILWSPSNLLTDYFAIANPGATLCNAAVTTLFTLLFLRRAQIVLTGPLVAALFTICGFAFFGKNLYNSAPFLIGIVLYARLAKAPLNSVVLVGLFSTALSPLISEITFGFGLSYWISVPLAYSVGTLIGLLMSPLGASFLRVHHGYNLYNIGFTAGILGMMIAGMLRLFKLRIETVSVLSFGHNGSVALLLYGIFGSMIALVLWQTRGKIPPLSALYKDAGRLLSDFLVLYDLPATFLNMALLGLSCTTYVLLVGGELNGPVVGGIFTVVGFGAMGKHLFNVTPVVVGIFLASLFSNAGSHQSTGVLLTTLFGTTLAPIAGHFGFGPGVLAGFIHLSMAANIGYLHGGMNLYNNGFSGGFVAAILVPLLEARQDLFRKE